VLARPTINSKVFSVFHVICGRLIFSKSLLCVFTSFCWRWFFEVATTASSTCPGQSSGRCLPESRPTQGLRSPENKNVLVEKKGKMTFYVSLWKRVLVEKKGKNDIISFTLKKSFSWKERKQRRHYKFHLIKTYKLISRTGSKNDNFVFIRTKGTFIISSNSWKCFLKELDVPGK